MKNLFAVAFVLFGFIGIFAQEVTIEKAEFDLAMYGSFQAMKGKPTRTTDEIIRESPFGSSTTKVVSERIGPAIHSVIENNSAAVSMKTESIFINGKRFTKNADNTWKVEPISSVRGQVSPFRQILDEKIYKSLGTGTLNGKTARIYKTIGTRKLVNDSTGDSAANNDTTIYYFDESRMMVRSENNSEQINTPKVDPNSTIIRKETKTIIKGTQVIEIDPTIKIEEPIIP